MGTLTPVGSPWSKTQRLLPPVPLLPHLFLIHNVLWLGGIHQTFLEQHKWVQCIPTASLSFVYRAREKPNDLPKSPAAMRTRAGLCPAYALLHSFGGGGSRAGAEVPASEDRGRNPSMAGLRPPRIVKGALALRPGRVSGLLTSGRSGAVGGAGPRWAGQGWGRVPRCYGRGLDGRGHRDGGWRCGSATAHQLIRNLRAVVGAAAENGVVWPLLGAAAVAGAGAGAAAAGAARRWRGPARGALLALRPADAAAGGQRAGRGTRLPQRLGGGVLCLLVRPLHRLRPDVEGAGKRRQR